MKHDQAHLEAEKRGLRMLRGALLFLLMYPFDLICRQQVCHPGSCKEFVTLGVLTAVIVKFPNPLSCPLALVALLPLRKELEAMEDTTAERVMMPNVVRGYEL
jgi:hypothetical protein